MEQTFCEAWCRWWVNRVIPGLSSLGLWCWEVWLVVVGKRLGLGEIHPANWSLGHPRGVWEILKASWFTTAFTFYSKVTVGALLWVTASVYQLKDCTFLLWGGVVWYISIVEEGTLEFFPVPVGQLDEKQLGALCGASLLKKYSLPWAWADIHVVFTHL